MPKKVDLSEQQLKQILELNDLGLSRRQIAERFNLSLSKVQSVITQNALSKRQAKVTTLITNPVVAETRKSVFDIVNRLEECLTEIEALKDITGPLKDMVAVRSEKRMLISEARSTLESIYNIQLLNEFIREVTTILEEQSPGARQRIYERLERSAKGSGAIGLFAPGGISQ